MKEFIFELQRFASYVVTANAGTGAVSVTNDGADTGISVSINDGEIDLTSSLTLSNGDSLTLSKSPETAEVNATFRACW